MKLIFTHIIIITIFFQAALAGEGEEKFNAKKNIKLAQEDLKRGNIYGAIDRLEKVMEHEPGMMDVAWLLAQNYQASRDYKNAEKHFKSVFETMPGEYPLAEYHYAMMMKMNGNYPAAREWFENFYKNYKGTDSYIYRRWAKTEMEGCDLAVQLKERPVEVDILHPDRRINSPYTDISPFPIDEHTLLFASLPSDTVITVMEWGKGPEHWITMYQAPFRGKTYGEAEPFVPFEVKGKHIANGVLSPDKQNFYYTICERNKDNRILCEIYMSKKEGEGMDGWSQPEKLPAGINAEDYNTTHPWLTPYKDGSQVLYFASDRPEGKGGMDIWYSVIGKNGAFSESKNSGSKINTDRDEATPFYDESTETLYFSSNGLTGMGGYDVFSATGSLGRFSEPQNVGYPLNSSTDDMYFRFAKSGRNGFIVSNRPGIFSIRSETCCDDIFRFEFTKEVIVAVEGLVYEDLDTAKPFLDFSAVSLLAARQDEEGVFLRSDTFVSPSPAFFSLKPEEDYKLTASKEGYLTSSIYFNTRGIKESDTISIDLLLKRLEKDKAYRLRNIYYDFDKWDLRNESRETLDTLYRLLVENPTIIIELSSHTDARGSDKYNKDLSQKRAESAVSYLYGKGIDKNRVTAMGYGENKMLEDCSNVEGCPETQQGDCPCHQLNRRTEFKITGELDAKLIYEDERFEGDESGEEDGKKKKRSKE